MSPATLSQLNDTVWERVVILFLTQEYMSEPRDPSPDEDRPRPPFTFAGQRQRCHEYLMLLHANLCRRLKDPRERHDLAEEIARDCEDYGAMAPLSSGDHDLDLARRLFKECGYDLAMYGLLPTVAPVTAEYMVRDSFLDDATEILSDWWEHAWRINPAGASASP